MPFLLPALGALVADAVIALVLGQHDPSHLRHKEQMAGATDTWIYATSYLTYLAALRVILLVVPLLFHSYTGTALRCVAAYHCLYWSTLLLVVGQMIGLALLNPESLEALLPMETSSSSASSSNTADNDMFYDLRRLWWMLLLTVLSNICHLILLVHVRSTAPVYGHLWNNGESRRTPSLYFQLRQYNSNQQQQQQRSSNGQTPLSPSSRTDSDDAVFLHTMNDFMDDVQARLRHVKAEWTTRLDDFTSRISAASQLTTASSGQAPQHASERSVAGNGGSIRTIHNPLAPTTPFRVLLQLFAYQDVLDNGKLDQVFELDDGVSVTFWVPQLLSFLLHGALETSPKLEEWILGKCRRNVQFAHRCYWFLKAWCLEAPLLTAMSEQSQQNESSVATGNAVALRNRNSSVTTSNAGLVPFLDEPAVADDVTDLCRPKRAMQPTMTATKFMPEERALIERLMLRVKECGEVSAQVLEYGAATPGNGQSSGYTEADDSSSDASFVSCQSSLVAPLANELEQKDTLPTVATSESKNSNAEWFQSPSKLMNAVEKGLVPINPSNGFPSVRHLDVVSSHHKYGFLPLEDGESRLSAIEKDHGSGETTQFDKTPHFLDTLLCLADRLFEVPVGERKEELRKRLQVIECELLPDNAIYMPIGNTNHRVWRIVPEESIPLGTKERVPCIVTLEVVSYKPKRYRPAGWDHLPKRTHHTLQSASAGGAESLPPTHARRPLMETLEMDSTESELLAEWRYGRRDPFRRTAFFDKVTGTMKGATDKMSAQMRERINLFRERSASDEMKVLKSAEEVSYREGSSRGTALLRADGNDGACDIEAFGSLHCVNSNPAGISNKRQIDSTYLSPSRSNSSASLASMGQWSSPHTKIQSTERHRHTRTSSMDDSDTSALPYGSNHKSSRAACRSRESAPAVSDGRRDNVAIASLVSARPPVVFRESWQAKECRIREKSAFGSHPGWRLLPILIKANDDLRQEQLAAQLIYRMAAILAREKVNVWLCPYEIIALTDSGGIVEAIPDTISIDSLRRNDSNFSTLRNFFVSHFGQEASEEFAGAQANFIESLAAYSIVCYLLQIKDRHNGNILLDNRGHVIHIDFGFFFLSSPGSNVGFESAPFKLTRDFVDLLGGPHSRLFRSYRELCYKCFITLRRNCMEIILMVEMLKQGNEELNCFRGRPDEAIRQLRERFRLDLNDRACRELVNCLIDDSMENWRTDWYDRYQRYFVGVF